MRMVPHPVRRSTLLCGTALQAAVGLVLAAPALVQPALAQPAPSARPQGGRVVAGSASIGATASTTTITQSSNRAAVDWSSFDVGRDQSVRFQQPSTAAVTLNRVTGGDPSAIAGQISANGQIVITNRSGVTFYEGAQVNAQSVIVSAAGISNQNFMAGRMAFDRPARPDARIDNRGTITVQQTGLAALVAPSVANSGVINARLGQVVLAGAAAHTLDMYGDGLVSIDVTRQVRQAPIGPDGKPVTALVTNTGVIRADGGVVQLTASAVDGVVQTLVRSGGTVRADTAAGRAGRIEIAGTGGSVVIEGRVAADGRVPGSIGGQVMVAGSDTTVLAPGAHVTAQGSAGGGTVAVGTTLARARSSGPAVAGTSARTVVAPGARVSADATGTGDGGRVTVLSTQHTSIGGALSARGGKTGGKGGMVELSGELGFRLTGTADTSAPHGPDGTILLDPRDLTIATTGGTNIAPSQSSPNIAYNTGGTATDGFVTPAQIQALTGAVDLQASRNLTVASSLTTNNSLRLEAGNNLTVNSGVTVSVTQGQTLNLFASASSIPGFNPAGTLTINGTVMASGINMGANVGGVAINGSVLAANGLNIATPGALIQATSSTISTPELRGNASSASLTSPTNTIGAVGSIVPFRTTAGGFALVDAASLVIGSTTSGTSGLSVPAGQSIVLTMDNLSLVSSAGVSALVAPGGTVGLQPLTVGRGITVSASVPGGVLAVTPGELNLVTGTTLQLGGGNTGNIVLGQFGETIDLSAHGGIAALALSTAGTVTQGGPLLVPSLSATARTITLTNTGNVIPSLNGIQAGGGLGSAAVTTSGDLAVHGQHSAGALTYTAGGNLAVAADAVVNAGGVTFTAGSPNVPGSNPAAALSLAGTVTATNTMQLTAGTGGIGLTGAVNAFELGFSTAGPVTQTAGGITANDLFGTAGSVSLPSASNAVGGVASQTQTFTVTGAQGDFTLVDSVPLTVGGASVSGGLSVQNQRTITLATDNLSISTGDSGPYLVAPNGVIVVEPLTPVTPIALTAGTKPANTLALTTAELAGVVANDLILGGTNPATGLPNSGTITIGSGGGAIDLGAVGFGALGLNTTGAVVQQAPLAVGTLSANAGSLTLNDGNNFIATLAGVSASTDLSLHTSNNLSVGQVSAGGNVTLSSSGSGGMTIFGNVTGQTVNLNSLAQGGPPLASDPGINQTGGIITATSLTGAAGFASFTRANQVSQLGDFATYFGFTFTDARPLALTGAVASQVSAVTLNAAGMTQTPASSITARELDGSSSADTVLNAPGNLIPQLGNFTQSAGNLTLATASPTLLFGANFGSTTAASGSLTFLADRVGVAPGSVAGGISAPLGTVTFAPFTPSRRIELIGTGAADPASLSLSQTFLNTVRAGTLQLGTAATPGTAASTGPINIGNTGDAITLAAVAPVLNLISTGAVTQGGAASLTVGTLSGSTGAATLGGGNRIGVLGSYQSGGAFQLNDTAPLAITGPVTSPVSVQATTSAALTVGGNVTAPAVTLQALGGTLTQTAGRIAASGTLELDASGLASQTGAATIMAGTLVGTAGSFALTQAGNDIAQLGAVTARGTVPSLQLTDGRSLTVNGPVAAGNTVIGLAAGDLVVNGSLSVNDLALTVPGNVIGAPGAAIAVAGTLSGTAQTLQFGNPVGVATLGNFRTAGDLTLAASAPLAATGTITSGTAIALSSQGPTVLSGNLSAPSVQVAAASSVSLGPNLTLIYRPGAITQTAGSITTTSLLQLLAGDTLTQSAGTIAGGAGAVLLSSVGTLSLGGAVSGGVVTLTAADRQALPAFQQPALAGSVIQTGGTLAATVLGGLSSAATTLTQAGNAVATLGNYNSVGGFALRDGQALVVAGPVTDPTSVTLTTSGTLTLNGTVQTGALSLTAGGAISQPAGMVTASSLSGSGAGVALTQQGNQVATLGSVASTGDFALTDGVAVTVSGAVSAGSGRTLTLVNDAPTFGVGGSLSAPGGTVALRDFTPGMGIVIGGGGGLSGTPPVTAATLAVGSPTGGPVTIAGAFNLSTVPVLDLESGGAIAETGAGAVRVGTLTGSGASASLGGANQIGTLGRFSAAGDFALTDTQPLVVSGPLAVSTLNLGVTGPLTLAGPVVAPNGTSLTASGAIIQTGGTLTTGSLTGSAPIVSLTGAGNAVAALGAFTTQGDFSLSDTGSLVVTAPVGLNTVTLTVSGDLILNSGITTQAAVLNAGGALTENGAGSIAAARLDGSAQSIALSGANLVGTLGNLSAGGALLFTDNQSLSVTGTVTAGPSLSIGATGRLSLSGVLSASSVTLSTGGDLMQSAGSVTGTAAVSLTAGGSLIQTGGALATGPLGAMTLASAGPIIAGGTVQAGTLSVNTQSGFAQTGGTITVDALSGTASGQISLGQVGTATVRSIGDLSSATGIAMLDSGPLQLAGTLAGPTVAILSTGLLELNGGVIATGPGSSLQVRAAGGIATINQLGTTVVRPFSGVASALTLALPASGGAMTLANLSAPQTDVVLNLGTGQASGQINVGNLLVQGSGGSATLTGTVASLTGFAAAQASRISPAVNTLYTLNGCAIQAASCSPGTLIPTTPATPTTPANPTTPMAPAMMPPASTVQPDIPAVQPTGPVAQQDLLAALAASTVRPDILAQLIAGSVRPDILAAELIASINRPDLLVLDVLDLSVTRDRDDPELLLPNISDRDY